MTWKDSRGIKIEEGSNVAYNRSGDVIEGWVVELRRSYVLIEPEEDFRNKWQASPYSKVKDGRSILVLG